jgi:hypothetical protein
VTKAAIKQIEQLAPFVKGYEEETNRFGLLLVE